MFVSKEQSLFYKLNQIKGGLTGKRLDQVSLIPILRTGAWKPLWGLLMAGGLQLQVYDVHNMFH